MAASDREQLQDLQDVLAGVLAAVVLIGNIISFGGLMFPGDLSAGIPTAIWAMLIGSGIGGVWIGIATSLPPLATGIDSPTGAVLVLLSTTAGSQVLAAGGSPGAAVQTVMLIFTAATVISGTMLYGFGVCRWGTLLPVCALLRRRRFLGRDRLVVDRRWLSNDDWTDF